MQTISPCHYDELLCGVDDALSMISSLLENSKQARSEYSTNWEKIQEVYEADMATFDNMLEKLSNSYRGGGKNKNSPTNSNNHAFNFHMHRVSDKNKGIDDIFILPPPTDDMDTSSVLDDSISHTIVSKADNANTKKGHKSLEQKRKMEQKMRFNAREHMLENLESMRKKELELERMLQTKNEDNEIPLDDGKRSELQETLDKYKQQQSRNIVKWVTSYKPKNIKKVGNKKLSQLCPSIKAIVEELKTAKGAQRTDNPHKSRRQGQGGNDKNNCEMIMNDSEQFMNLEDLPFRPLAAAIGRQDDSHGDGREVHIDDDAYTSNSGDKAENSTATSDYYDDDYDDYEPDYDDSFHEE